MATLVSPGALVTVTDESQYGSIEARDTIPLFVLATHQDKATPDASETAEYTTAEEAGKIKLITSQRELVQKYGDPVFYDVNGTVQQGYELNEYGLLAAYRTAAVTNRVYVVRGDIDLAQLIPTTSEPTSDALNETYWFDITNTKFGIFRYVEGEWVLIAPKLLNSTTNLTADGGLGYAPKSSYGVDGDIAATVINDSTSAGAIRLFEKIDGTWYYLGSPSWEAASPTIANASTLYSSASSQTLATLPGAGSTIIINIDGAGAVTSTLEVIVTGTGTLSATNTLGLKTFIANSSTVTLGTTTGANITGTADFATNSEQTGASVGDVLAITDTAGTDNVTLRIKVAGSGASYPLTGSVDINGETITFSTVANATAYAAAVNAVIGTSGTSPQGIVATVSGTDIVLTKASAVSGENNPNEILIANLVESVGDSGLTAASTKLSVVEVVESINDQVSNTDNIVATVNGSGPYNVRIADSATGVALEDVTGTPLTDLEMVARSVVPLADIETEIEAGISNTEVDDSASNDVPAAGQNLKITFSGTGAFTIGAGTANTELGFTAAAYRVSLNQVVTQVNAANSAGGWATTYSTAVASVVTSDGSSHLKVSDSGSGEMVFTGTGSATLGLTGTYSTNQIYFSEHYNVPSSPEENDIWVKTTTPNNGADFIVKYWNALTNQWIEVDAPIYDNNNDAFDGYGTDLSAGDLYIKSNISEETPTRGSFYIRRYNGNTDLELVISSDDFTAGGNIEIGNGRAANATVTAASISALVEAINNLAQDNLVAEETEDGAVIRNNIGEDIVLADGSSTVADVFGGDYEEGVYSNWTNLRNWLADSGASSYEVSGTAPTIDPEEGNLWYNADLDINEIDILVNVANQWTTFTGDVQFKTNKPTLRSDSTALQNKDLWINTSDLENYPLIYKYSSVTGKWVLVDNTDQTTVAGILFRDARVDADSDLDPDCPNPLLYPVGMLLWNTRASSYVVKEYKPNWFGDESDEGETFDSTDYTVESYDIGNTTFSAVSSAARWVTVSGNRLDGSPYMGRHAQRIMIVRAMAAAVANNEDLRDVERNFFNLIVAPGYPELIDELVALNIDRRETAFIISDTPFRLRNNSTEVQEWATNANNAASTGDDGLTTLYTFASVHYPPMGLTTNLDGSEVAMPSSLGALYAYLYNDNVAYPWYAPAGLNRGLLSGVFSSVGYLNAENEYTPAQIGRGLQDTLYTNKINPIVFGVLRGLYLNGEKTLHSQASALDRVNVARLIVYLRYQLELLAQPFLFQPNVEETRVQVRQTFERFLGDLIGLRALYDFVVVCDEGNNSPERIDRNELWIDIAIQPVKTIEFIYIPLRVKNTGEDLTA